MESHVPVLTHGKLVSLSIDDVRFVGCSKEMLFENICEHKGLRLLSLDQVFLERISDLVLRAEVSQIFSALSLWDIT